MSKKKVTSKTGGGEKYITEDMRKGRALAKQVDDWWANRSAKLPSETRGEGIAAKGSAKPKAKAAPKKVNRTKENLASAPKATRTGVMDMSSKMKGSIQMPAKREYTDKEKKIAAVMAKGKKKNGTMRASAQRKI